MFHGRLVLSDNQNDKMIVDSIENGPYNDIKRMDADDQAIQTILLGLPEDVYAAVDSCETTKKIWERVRQMMKGSNIEEQEKKAKLFNEWEKFTSTDGESTESYYYHFIQLMNDFKRNKHFPENIAANLKFLNNLQPKWKRHVTIVRQTKNLHEADFTQIYDFLKMNQDETQLLIAQKEEAGIQLQAEEFDFMATAGDLDKIEEVNANCIFMANLQHASTFGTQLDKAPSYGTDGSAEKMALGYPNPSYLKKAQLKKQGLYNGNLLLEEHDPPVVYDSEETLKLAQESREKMRFLKKEIKPANYAKINHLSGFFVPQTTKSKEELFLSNVSNMVNVSKTISIPNEDLSDDTTPSVAQKFLNEVKSSLVTLQRVVKQKMTLEVHNWSSSAHKEVHKIISHELAPIINQVDARVQNFEIQFLQEAAKFVRDFKSLTKEADESLDKEKSLELEIERLLKASVSHDIMSIVQKWLWISVTPQVDKPKLIFVTPCSKKLHASIPSHSVPQPREFNVVKHRNVIAPGMFKIDPSQTSRVDLVPNKQSSESFKTNPITNSQRHVTSKENVSSDTVNASSTGLVHNARTRRPQPKGNSRNARVPSASKSSEVKENVTVEDHRRILLLSKNQKTMSSECNNIKLAIWNDKFEIVYGTCKQCLVTANHGACLLSFVNALNSRANNMCANSSPSANQKRHRT
nr:hypothetical protein [Tanacetum cinerariifolium]